METLKLIEDQISIAKAEAVKVEKGVKAAKPRLRKVYSEIAKLCKQGRQEVFEIE